jgi:hypothetical protein
MITFCRVAVSTPPGEVKVERVAKRSVVADGAVPCTPTNAAVRTPPVLNAPSARPIDPVR